MTIFMVSNEEETGSFLTATSEMVDQLDVYQGKTEKSVKKKLLGIGSRPKGDLLNLEQTV